MRNNILVDFSLLFDIDLGLIKTIKEGFNNKEVFEQFLFNIDDEYIISQLYLRKEINPLSLIIMDKYKSQCDDLLEQFTSEEHSNIIKNSTKTNAFKLIEAYSISDLVNIDVLCKNISEEQLIKSLNLNKVNAIVQDNISLVNIKTYDSIYLKDVKDSLKFKNLKGKHIYVGNYKFNLEKKDEQENIMPLFEVVSVLADVNEFLIIDIYDKENIIEIKG